MPDTYDWADDSRRSYDIGIACMREEGIRAGKITPRLDDPDEMRWAMEGPVPVEQLESRMGL